MSIHDITVPSFTKGGEKVKLTIIINPRDEAERAKATEFAKRVGTHVSSAGEVVFVINGVPLAQLVEVITEAEAYESRAIFYYSA